MIIRNDYTKQIAIDKIKALDLSKEMVFTLAPYKAKRSLSQNSLYWMWVGIMAKDIGESSNDFHALMAHKFLAPEVKEVMGERVEIVKSTTKLNVHEFTEYLNQIEMFSSGFLGIVLPRPEDMYYAAMGYERKGST